MLLPCLDKLIHHSPSRLDICIIHDTCWSRACWIDIWVLPSLAIYLPWDSTVPKKFTPDLYWPTYKFSDALEILPNCFEIVHIGENIHTVVSFFFSVKSWRGRRHTRNKLLHECWPELSERACLRWMYIHSVCVSTRMLTRALEESLPWMNVHS